MKRQADANGRAVRTWYFFGGDTAPAQKPQADDGAITVLRIRLREEQPDDQSLPQEVEQYRGAFVFARVIRDAATRQWAGYTQALHRRFKFTRLMYDPHGGGQWVRTELRSNRAWIDGAEQEVIPLVTVDDLKAPVVCQYGLHFFSRGDAGIEQLWGKMAGDDVLVSLAHNALRDAVSRTQVAWPKPAREWRREELAGWSQERQLALAALDRQRKQFGALSIETREDGTYALTKNNVQKILVRGRKDLAYSALYAWTAFLVWLKQPEDEWDPSPGETSITGWSP